MISSVSLNIWKDEIAIPLDREDGRRRGLWRVGIWRLCFRQIKLEMPRRNPSGDGESSQISILDFSGEMWIGNINL